MKRFALVLLVAISALALLQCAGEKSEPLSDNSAQQLALLPEDASGLAYVNLDELKNSVFYEMAIDSINQRVDRNDQFQEFMEKTGFDIRKDVSEIYIAFAPDLQNHNENHLVVALGKFEPEKILAFVREKGEDAQLLTDAHNSHTLYSIEHDKDYDGDNPHEEDGSGREYENDTRFAFVDGTYLIGGNQDYVQAWLDRYDSQSDQKPSNNVLAKLNDLKYKQSLWFTMDAEQVVQELMNEIGDRPEARQFAAMESIEMVTGSANLAGDVKVDGRGKFSDAEQAELFRDAIKGALATVKLANSYDREMVDIINKINVDADGGDVRIQFEMTRAEVEKLIQQRTKMAMR